MARHRSVSFAFLQSTSHPSAWFMSDTHIYDFQSVHAKKSTKNSVHLDFVQLSDDVSYQ